MLNMPKIMFIAGVLTYWFFPSTTPPLLPDVLIWSAMAATVIEWCHIVNTQKKIARRMK